MGILRILNVHLRQNIVFFLFHMSFLPAFLLFQWTLCLSMLYSVYTCRFYHEQIDINVLKTIEHLCIYSKSPQVCRMYLKKLYLYVVHTTNTIYTVDTTLLMVLPVARRRSIIWYKTFKFFCVSLEPFSRLKKQFNNEYVPNASCNVGMKYCFFRKSCI